MKPISKRNASVNGANIHPKEGRDNLDTFDAMCSHTQRKWNLIKSSAAGNEITMETKLSSLNCMSFPVWFYDSQLCALFM